MPRDGSNIYTQPFPDVATGTTIESTVYNGYTADITIDLNTARPIIAGGTGANNTLDAMVNLGGEVAKQAIDNYNSYPFVSGSFYSVGGATGEPVAMHNFAGICYAKDANNMVLEARDESDTVVPGRKYVREKKAGAWGVWKTDALTTVGDATGIANDASDMFFGVEGTAPNSAFVVNSESDNSGTDALRVFKNGAMQIERVDGNPTLTLNKSAAAGSYADIYATKGQVNRWLLRMSDEAAESGSNVGSNFVLHRYADDGSYLGSPFNINRGNAAAQFTGALNVAGATTLGGGISGNTTVTGNLTATSFLIGAQATLASNGTAWQLNLRDTVSGYNKYLRTASTGNFEIINHAFSAPLMWVGDNGSLDAAETITGRAASANQFKARHPNYSVFHRNDGGNYWPLLTNRRRPGRQFQFSQTDQLQPVDRQCQHGPRR